MNFGGDDGTTGDVNQKVSVHDEKDVNLSKFQLIRILDTSVREKTITFEALYKDQKAVIRLEKTILDEQSINELLKDHGCIVEREFHNDIYGNYFSFPSEVAKNLISIKTTLIHPATEAVIIKYTKHKRSFIHETCEEYYRFVEDHVLNRLGPDKESIRWVYNILEHKSEQERVIFDLQDQENGFMMLPDLRWGGKVDDLYMLAICYRRDIKSLRDLSGLHLKLLNNILSKGTEVICSKYKISKSNLRVFIHYQPTFYHFHVHFKYLGDSGQSEGSDRDNLLVTVINNIMLRDDYYQKATLTYPLTHLDPLYEIFANQDKSDK